MSSDGVKRRIGNEVHAARCVTEFTAWPARGARVQARCGAPCARRRWVAPQAARRPGRGALLGPHRSAGVDWATARCATPGGILRPTGPYAVSVVTANRETSRSTLACSDKRFASVVRRGCGVRGSMARRRACRRGGPADGQVRGAGGATTDRKISLSRWRDSSLSSRSGPVPPREYNRRVVRAPCGRSGRFPESVSPCPVR